MGTVSNREMLVARWAEVVNDPSLHDVPYKIELNAEGTIEMSPANNWHAAAQGYLARFPEFRLREGEKVKRSEGAVRGPRRLPFVLR